MNKLTRGLSFADYLALEWLNFSSLKWMDVSAQHYEHAIFAQRAETRPLRIGRLTHATVLTPDLPSDVAIWEGRRAGKLWEAFEAENEGKLIVKAEDLAGAEAMRKAVLAHPIARSLLEAGEGEVTLEWEMNGLQCRGRLDWLRPDGTMVELKTTRAIAQKAFAREVGNRLYHAQVAFYADGLATILGKEAPILPHMIVVENVPPHSVAVYRVGYDAIEAGRRKVDAWLRAVKACTEADHWPGVDGGDVLEMRVPEWATNDGEDVNLGSLGGEAA